MRLIPADAYTIQELTEAYNQTRVDYLVPMPMTAKRLHEYVVTYDISLADSVVSVEDDGTMLGLSMLALREGRSWITRLGVLPTARRAGIGYELMEYMIQRSVEKGVKTIHLEVITGNEPAYRLFQNLGFEPLRELLILRRPPAPGAFSAMVEPHAEWLDEAQTLKLMASRPWPAAWTNQIESARNAGGVKALHIGDPDTGESGWVTYQKGMMQLKRIMVSPDDPNCAIPAHRLLDLLHKQFPTLDSIAENVPVDVEFLNTYLEHKYVESFRRIEMIRPA